MDSPKRTVLSDLVTTWRTDKYDAPAAKAERALCVDELEAVIMAQGESTTLRSALIEVLDNNMQLENHYDYDHYGCSACTANLADAVIAFLQNAGEING